MSHETIDWSRLTKEDAEIIRMIAKRAVASASANLMDAEMDIAACHISGCPLHLADLLKADEVNFAHDVAGIRRYIDRQTGKLGDCFFPQFAAKGG